jgi:two-component system alkaline phosphatase synthesis response regulator PhoP
MPKILVIGATESIATALQRALRDSGCELCFTQSEARALAKAVKVRPDMAVLDATGGDLDVPSLCNWLRERFVDLPLMVLSPEGVKFAKELRINMHLMQPFTGRKLGNRIKKLLVSRRNQPLTVGSFTLDPEKRRLIHGGHVVRLTPKEYRLLEVLMLHPGVVLSRKQIMKEVWETDYLGDTRTLDVHIRWVREKIEVEPAEPIYLRTVRRVGYVFDPTAAPEPSPIPRTP